jgi:hypothetical protein
MTMVIEWKAVFTHEGRRWHLVKGAVCQDVIEEATPSTTRKDQVIQDLKAKDYYRS